LKRKTCSHIRVKVIWLFYDKLVKNADDAVYDDADVITLTNNAVVVTSPVVLR